MKCIVVVGGVYSGTGKGVAAASLAMLLKARSNSVTCIKYDPYLNINAGIIRPTDHGEVWVTDDGCETDLDLGTYQRIADINVGKENICTAGTLYKELIEEQESGKYLGSTVQIIPHLTDKIQNRIIDLSKDFDIVICEIGGTVGDIESGAFYEAIRQLKQKYDNDVLITMVAPILWVPTISEYKTKPLQNSVKELQRHGLQPDILLCRTPVDPPCEILEKISSITNVSASSIFSASDAKSIYQVPINFYNNHIDDLISDKFHLKRVECKIHKYRQYVERYLENDFPSVTIGVFGKYSNCDEAYVSLKEALYHAGLKNDIKINVKWINSEEIESIEDENEMHKYFNDLIGDTSFGMIVPGGFDKRGVEGKIKAIEYARKNKIPFLGICLGLQCAVIEFARNVCGLAANSLEFDLNCADPVINFVDGQKDISNKCGTMRLGAYNCELFEDTLVKNLYNGKKIISERHRHRYEVNGDYENILREKGLIVSGVNPDTGLVEMMELKQELHPFFVGTQSHPEFKSKLLKPSPLFDGLIQAVSKENIG